MYSRVDESAETSVCVLQPVHAYALAGVLPVLGFSFLLAYATFVGACVSCSVGPANKV